METLYPNFLNDPEEYRQAETLWRTRWTELLQTAGQAAEWQSPWANTTFADGTPCLDGNPIFSAVCPSRRRGIRVIQHEPAENPGEFTFWTDTFAEGEPEEVKELVISCALTPATLKNSLDLMKQWLDGKEVRHADEDDMDTTGHEMRPRISA